MGGGFIVSLIHNEYYQQIKKTMMGMKTTLTYAIPTIFDEDFRNWIELVKYFDCCLFSGREEMNLEKFCELANNLYTSINFPMEANENRLLFLDILIIKRDAKIIMNLFCQNTDTHQHLNFMSCHASHIKCNIPFETSSKKILRT